MAITLYGSGQNIIKVVQTVKTDTYSTATTSYTDIPSLSATITPSNSANKILVVYSLCVGNSVSGNRSSLIQIVRNGTAIALGDARGSTTRCTTAGYTTTPNYTFNHAMAYLDSPSTVSAVTYKLQVSGESSTIVVGGSSSTSNFYNASTPSVITLYEVAYA
jgi:hypothetical protein